jgi:hypothetical protein
MRVSQQILTGRVRDSDGEHERRTTSEPQGEIADCEWRIDPQRRPGKPRLTRDDSLII